MRRLAAFAVAAMLLTGCGSSEPASRSAEIDLEYLNGLSQVFDWSAYGTARDQMDLGLMICSSLDSGMSAWDAINTMTTSGFDPETAMINLFGAAFYLCPEHKAKSEIAIASWSE